MKTSTSVGISLALIMINASMLQGANAHGVRAQLTIEENRKPAPDFKVQDASGRKVRLSDYRGKVLLVNFWATWCGGCKLEIPWFQNFETTLGRQGFAVLGMSLDEQGWTAVKPYIDKANVTFRMALADKSTAADYAVTSMPATFIVDRKGRIAATYIGLVDRTDIEMNIKSLLRKARLR